MIYDFPDKYHPIRQGDIFYPLPLISIDLNKLPILKRNGEFEESNWQRIKDRDQIVISAAIKTVCGIVATQDCDAMRSPIISFFTIEPFQKVTGLDLPRNPRKWMSLIIQKSRLNARWLYLPNDNHIGFMERMAINFQLVFHVSRKNLEENLKELRRGRLNEVAYQHYRESIAQYFRRYPYDEWYSLDKEEFEEYKKEKGDVEPFDWQK